ncbi:MAG: hypothetical protein K0S65_6804 [Labilithrix sp.]|jgi:peptidoglycan/LPS O-acetylase OafA/YrhL|nr:hypothetical protein [Labilithrix sp.]
MLFHYAASTNRWGVSFHELSAPIFGVAKFGYFGVDLFFVISGFVILMSAWGRPLGAFVASRTARLYPAYWFAVLFTGALLLVTAPEDVTIKQILVNLTMGQSAFGVEHVDGVYWTLWIELHFYVLIGMFLLIGITRNRILVFCGLWPIVASIADASDAHLLATILQPTYAPLFAGGMLIYLLSLDHRSTITWLLLGANVLWAIPTAGADAAAEVGRQTGAGMNDIVMIVVTISCFLLVAAVTLTPLRRTTWRWLTLAGLLTYPLYLVHEQLGWTIISGLTPSLPWGGVLTIAILSSLVLAIAINVLIERRSAKPLRKAVQLAIDTLNRQETRPSGRRTADPS